MDKLKKDLDSMVYQYWHDTAKLHYEYGEKLRAIATLKDGWGMGIPEANDYCVEHFEFGKLRTDNQSVLTNYRRNHGLIAIIKPCYYEGDDERCGNFEVMVWDMRDVDNYGTEKHDHTDVGYKIHFITEDEDSIVDKLFPTYESAEKACIEKMQQLCAR